eukprot:CAMPEP_0170562632 /NCGR_PEP_ID=MMETSP0211-20121228/61653_1 /TAXON_ID=311385 /ORGANISM="Pseudokeronopsis sp., Strain OXSARD2" /LENGTH=59 /DNA_ID=CAMNT_0010879763 /DNA_START=734 /DNA_END=913 /DNA_ORIENTATION=-
MILKNASNTNHQNLKKNMKSLLIIKKTGQNNHNYQLEARKNFKYGIPKLNFNLLKSKEA